MNIRLALFLALAFTTASAPSFAAGDRYALVIGNAKYPDADTPIKEAVNDARGVADELSRDGFNVEIADNLGRESMRRAFDGFYAKIKPASLVVFFFSGFGIQAARQSYLIPVDAQIWTEADVRRDGFSLETVLDELDSRGAAVKIALLDASRRNPYERRFRNSSAGLAPVIAPNGTLVMYSAAPGSVIRDNTGDHSLFVQELLNEIRKPGSMAEEVLNRTQVDVTRASRSEQVPWISSSLAEGFTFVPSPPSATATETTASHPSERPQPPQKTDIATDQRPNPQDTVREDYELALQLGTRDGWTAFLAQYPDGFYANLAKGQLNKLSAETARAGVAGKARLPNPEKTGLTTDGARTAELTKKAAAPAGDEDRVAAEKAKQVELEKDAAEEKVVSDNKAQAGNQIEDPRSKQVATVSPTTTAPPSDASANSNRESGIRGTNSSERSLFTPEDNQRVAAMGAKLGLKMPPFDIAATERDYSSPFSRFVGVWSSERAWGNGRGRHGMLIITEVSATGLARGYYLWGPPTKQSWNQGPAGYSPFAEYIANDTLTLKPGDTIIAKLDENNMKLSSFGRSNRSQRSSVEFRPIWQLSAQTRDTTNTSVNREALRKRKERMITPPVSEGR